MDRTTARSAWSGALALALLVNACDGGTADPPTGISTTGSPTTTVSPATEGSIADLSQGATEVSLIPAQSGLGSGEGLFTFGLVTQDGGLITGGAPEVYLAQDRQGPAVGPFPASFHEFTAFERFPNEAPVTPLTGFYAAQVDVPEAGTWVVAGLAQVGGESQVGVANVTVTDDPVAGEVGTEALSVATPVAASDDEAREICTREPPDPLHSISLDEALTNGKPTIITFGTPLLCTSRMCGPVVDEVMVVHEDVGPDRANFIHLEIYPERDQARPAEEFVVWGFTTEPITLVIDRDAIIRVRYEGPVTADLLAEDLNALL